MALPQLTPEERQANLKKAAELRHLRSELKIQLHDGKITPREALTSEDDAWRGMKVSAVLQAIPGIGKSKCAAIMETVGIAENRRVRGLGKKQLGRLLDILEKTA